MIKLKDNSKRAEHAQLTLKIALIGTGLLVLGIALLAKTIIDINSGGTIDFQYIGMVGTISMIVSVLFFAAYIVATVFFIMWFRRAYFNLHQIFKKGLYYSEGWAAGAWFVPIFNLWGPFNIAKDLFVKSKEVLSLNNIYDAESHEQPVYKTWWALWIISGIITRVGDKMQDSIEFATAGYILTIVGMLISIGAGLMAIKMIKQYSKIEALLPSIGTGNIEVDKGVSDSDLLDDNI